MIAREHLRDLPNGFPLRERTSDREEQGKVEERVDLRVHAVEACSTARKERHERRIAIVQLTDDRQLRVLALESLHPALPEGARHIRPRVLPDTVEAEDADPPE